MGQAGSWPPRDRSALEPLQKGQGLSMRGAPVGPCVGVTWVTRVTTSPPAKEGEHP